MENVWLLLLSLAGFLNAYLLHWQYLRQQKSGKKMLCFLGGDCGAVVSSPYGTTLGVKNEVIGMAYYLVLLVLSFLKIISPGLYLEPAILAVALVAAGFAVYLIYVQVVVLKKICSWCLLAIGINLTIFILAIN